MFTAHRLWLLVPGVLLLGLDVASAQGAQPDFWGTNGFVTSIARVGNTIYIGGWFSIIGPNTGGGVPVDPSSGAPLRPFPRVAGYVSAVIPDGDGGWFIGGAFTAVEGVPHANLAHLLADGSVAAWSADAEEPDSYSKPSDPLNIGPVASLALKGRTLFIGGRFTRIGSQTRRHLAAVDAVSGALLPFDPAPDGAVTALVVRGNRLYVGGGFRTIGGQVRSNLAELDAATGIPTAWDPSGDGSVRTIAIHGKVMFVGGEFDHIGGASRNSIAALDLDTGRATSWEAGLRPRRQYIAHGDWIWPFVSCLVVRGSTVYATGYFDSIGGRPLSSIAALDLVSAAATGFDARSQAGFGRTLALVGNTLYVGGYFYEFGGQVHPNAAALDATTGAPLSWNPQPVGIVQALAPGRGAIYAGGTFETIHDFQTRHGLAALDARTGVPLSWSPEPDTYYIPSLVATERALYIAGDFTQVNGEPRRHLASFDPETGALSSWNPWTVERTPGHVERIARIGNTIYAGGQFDEINGIPRRSLAAIDATSGAILDWDPRAHGPYARATALQPHGNTLYVGGDFDSLGGAGRRYVAAVDGTTGVATAWPGPAKTTDYVSDVYAIAPVNEAVHVGGWFLGFGGQFRLGLAAFDAGGALLPWNPAMDVAFSSWVVGQEPAARGFAVHGGDLVVAGRFDEIGGRSIRNLAVVDLATGMARDWNPDVGPVPGFADRYGVQTIALYGDTLYVGGGFSRLAGLPRAAFGALTLPPATSRAHFATKTERHDGAAAVFGLASPLPSPARSSTALRFTLPAAASVNLEVFDLQGRRVATPLERDPRGPGHHEITLSTRGWKAGVYYCRLEAAGRAATRKMLVLE